ncbi:MAG: GxxExxY protein [Bacteroidia bacterium]|nr:GxxExxY protein [Bacteroidia bacterium]MCF8427123.1 GxxExxY protein [Bacteroidia bacterium]
MEDFNENELSKVAIDCAIKVHRNLGPGLLESVYKECLYFELGKMNLLVEKEKPLPVVYESIKLECGYRADIVINNKLILELKSVEGINEIHVAQTLTYLKLSSCKLALLINFNVLYLKDGLKRIIKGKL